MGNSLLNELYRLAELNHATLIGVVAASAYLLWRIWTFTLLPALRPSDPKLLPYWIPLWGHAGWLLKDQIGLMRYGSEYFGTQPFALQAMGRTIYILSGLNDINAMYKTGPSISFEQATRTFMTKSCGISKEGDELLYMPGHRGSFPNPHGRAVALLSRDIIRATLEAPEGLQTLADVFQRRIDEQLRPGSIPKECIIAGSGSSMKVSLYKLCQWAVITAGSDTFFGPYLRELCAENFTQTFITYDADVAKVLQGLPPSMAKDAHRCRALLIDATKKFVESPQQPRSEYTATVVTQMEEELRAAGTPIDDIAIQLFFVNWLFNVNTFKLSFWMLAWIISNPTLHREVLDELTSAQSQPAACAPPTITNLMNACPILNAVFDEAQRLTVSALSSRLVTEDTQFNGYTYRAGSTILVFYRQLHFQKQVFGDDIETFDHKRFLHQKGLARDKNFKPFGGGSTLCTGRFLARREVLLFVAMVLSKWDLHKESDGFPELELTKPSLGTVEPKSGHDITVRVSVRAK